MAVATTIEEFKKQFRILIVDDNEDNILVLKLHLQKEGYTNLSTAKNGSEALSLISSSPIDLVLLDIMMPDISGLDVLSAIQDKVTKNQIMVIMISANDDIETVVKCIRSGAEDFLPKPFNREILRARVEKLLSKKLARMNEEMYLNQINIEKRIYSNLLHAVFPSVVVDYLQREGKMPPRYYDNVVVFFIDIVGFTEYCEQHTEEDIVIRLEKFFTICEKLALSYNVQKIKTIGDSVMLTAGLLTKNKSPVIDSIECAQEIIQEIGKYVPEWSVRVGMDYGRVMGGIVGSKQYLFDVWGDIVNTAARIQKLAAKDTIYLSESAYLSVSSFPFPVIHSGSHEVKGKHLALQVYRVEDKSNKPRRIV
ncbi:MAG: response regulator [Gammaproteobacteria bacterium]|nr:response regulator [Gammaproteobacteria bacterium]